MLKGFIKKFTTKGLRRSLRTAAIEFEINSIHRRGVRRAQSLKHKNDLKLHFGCGPNMKAGFINIDLRGKADLGLDLREPLPFRTDSCSMIYSEHFLEHLIYPDDALCFLNECFRVLQPEGVFSAGVPDAEWPVRAFAGDPYYADWFAFSKRIFPKSDWIMTRMELVNFDFRQFDEHKFAYDFETLKRILEKAGLVRVKRRDFDPALDSEKSRFSLDTDTRKCTTLYVDAIKPIPEVDLVA